MIRTHFDKKNKLWTGNDIPQLFNPKISVAQVLLRSMKMNGSKTAQINVDSGTHLKYNDLHKKTIQIAQNLMKRGYEPRQKFLFMAKHSDYVAPVFFGSFCLACPVHIISSSASKSHVIHAFEASKPSIIFCDVDVYDSIEECFKTSGFMAKIFTFNGVKGNSEAIENLFEETGTEESFIPIPVDATNEILIKMDTSGTTGPPKGILLSHAAVLSSAETWNFTIAEDIFLNFSSLDWISGFQYLLLPALNGHTRVFTARPFSPELFVRIVEDYKVSYTINIPLHIFLLIKSGLLAKANLSSIRLHIVGGNRSSANLLKEYNSYLPNGRAFNTYGLSETCGIVTMDYPKFSGTDTVGQLASGHSIKIIDENGQRCGVDVDGELCIKCPYKFLGYDGNEQLNRDCVDEEGFFLTGDIGHADKNGYFFIVGREKDLIRYWGETHSPCDVELFLLGLPEILDACITVIPNVVADDLPAAVIVLNKNSSISGKDIVKLVEDNFPDFCKLDGGVYFVDSIPKTRSGKLLRRKAQSIAVELFAKKHNRIVI